MPDALDADYTRSQAVLIGTWDYENLEDVPPARSSFDRMHRMLTGPLCHWPEDRIHLVPNPAVLGNLPDLLVEKLAPATDVALFYYVGHGQYDNDYRLCLAVENTSSAAARRTTTSLTFDAVRHAFKTSQATTKIAILDCCFAGLAAGEHGRLSPSENEIPQARGFYLIMASGEFTPAWYELGPDGSAQTYFTKYFINAIESGIPGTSEGLPLGRIFDNVADALARDGKPEPGCRTSDHATHYILARNIAHVAAASPSTDKTDHDSDVGHSEPTGEVPPSTRPSTPVRGPDVEARGVVGFRHAILGGSGPVQVKKSAPCGECGGTGFVPVTEPGQTATGASTNGPPANTVRRARNNPILGMLGRAGQPSTPERSNDISAVEDCPSCGGSGVEDSVQVLRLEVPPGLTSGQRQTYEELGEPGQNGGDPGNLCLEVEVEQDELFHRDGDDLAMKLKLSYCDLISGTRVHVPTLHGVRRTRAPRGAVNGQVLRIRGEGVMRTGDLIITLVATESRAVKSLERTGPTAGNRQRQQTNDSFRLQLPPKYYPQSVGKYNLVVVLATILIAAGVAGAAAKGLSVSNNRILDFLQPALLFSVIVFGSLALFLLLVLLLAIVNYVYDWIRILFARRPLLVIGRDGIVFIERYYGAKKHYRAKPHYEAHLEWIEISSVKIMGTRRIIVEPIDGQGLDITMKRKIDSAAHEINDAFSRRCRASPRKVLSSMQRHQPHLTVSWR